MNPPVEKPATPEPGTPPETPADVYSEFSSVFDELTDAGEESKKPEPKSGPVTDTDKAAVQSKEEGAEPEPKAETPAPEAKPETPEPEGDATDWKAKFEELQAQVNANAGKSASAPAAVEPETAPAAKKEEPAPAQPVYTEDEQKFLADYDKEWPDVIKGEALKRRAEYHRLATHIFGEMNRVYGPLIQKAVETSESFEDDITLRTITAAHPDYDEQMYDAVVEWADGLKGYAHTLATGIIKEGSPQDVVGLISEYKKATGKTSKPAVAVAPAASASVTELPAAAKKAAKALGVVESKRGASQPSAAPDPNDFDAAWDEAVNAK